MSNALPSIEDLISSSQGKQIGDDTNAQAKFQQKQQEIKIKFSQNFGRYSNC